MEYFIITLLNISLTLLINLAFQNYSLRQTINNNIPSDVQNYTQNKEKNDEDDYEISSYELERIARERDFDNRIALLKQELAYENNMVGTTAEILDPNIYNLPHDSVTQYNDDEIAY